MEPEQRGVSPVRREELLRILQLPKEEAGLQLDEYLKAPFRPLVRETHEQFGLLIVPRRGWFCVEYWDKAKRRTVRRSTGIKLRGQKGKPIGLPQNAGQDPCWWFVSQDWDALFDCLEQALPEKTRSSHQHFLAVRRESLRVMVWDGLARMIGELLVSGYSYVTAKTLIGELLSNFEAAGNEIDSDLLSILLNPGWDEHAQSYQKSFLIDS